MTSQLRSQSSLLGFIVVGGLLLRVLFLVYGAPVYYHDSSLVHLNGDSGSYMWAFENLLLKGHYSFDFLEPDAAFGRLPGYPFFYGLHYLVFGAARAAVATVCTQTLLDAGAVLVVYGIVRQLAPTSASSALVGAALYAAYPFIILWVPVIGTETLATDLTLLWVYMLVAYRSTTRYALALGLLTAVCFFVREYLGILFPITLGYLLLQYGRQPGRFEQGSLGRAVRAVVLVGLGFGVLYVGWPLRNYFNEHRLMLVKTKTAGYANYTPDVDSYYRWVHAWTYDENVWLDKLLSGKPVDFPHEAVETPADVAEARRLVALARTCGSGFYVRRVTTQPVYRDTAAMLHNPEYRRFHFANCNSAISAGFSALEQRYAERHPWKYRFSVPLQNLRKGFFKSDTIASHRETGDSHALLLRVLFGYRTLLLLLGLAGLWRHWKLRLLPVALFFIFMYLFISFFLRGLEMRYLLQADAALLVPAALLLGHWLDRWLPAVRPAAPPVAA